MPQGVGDAKFFLSFIGTCPRQLEGYAFPKEALACSALDLGTLVHLAFRRRHEVLIVLLRRLTTA